MRPAIKINPASDAEELMYPSTDEVPMSESDIHTQTLIALVNALDRRFADRDDVYVASNTFLYYREAAPVYRRSPDIMVVFGVPDRPRRVYKTWEEGDVFPTVVIEIASRGSFAYDQEVKIEVCQNLRIPEYYIFDPEREYLDRPAFAYALEEGTYRERPEEADGGFDSPALGVRFVPEGHTVAVIDLATGLPIPTIRELDAIATGREAALADERRRADDERRRADEQQQRAETLEAEVARLRSLLQQRTTNGGPPAAE